MVILGEVRDVGCCRKIRQFEGPAVARQVANQDIASFFPVTMTDYIRKELAVMAKRGKGVSFSWRWRDSGRKSVRDPFCTQVPQRHASESVSAAFDSNRVG